MFCRNSRVARPSWGEVSSPCRRVYRSPAPRSPRENPRSCTEASEELAGFAGNTVTIGCHGGIGCIGVSHEDGTKIAKIAHAHRLPSSLSSCHLRIAGSSLKFRTALTGGNDRLDGRGAPADRTSSRFGPLPRLPRIADFAAFGEAVGRTLASPGGDGARGLTTIAAKRP
jgi:hypothetical protein